MSDNSHGNDNDQTITGWFEEVAENAGRVQTETLKRILELNWGVEYLKIWWGDSKNKSIEEMDGSELESLYTSVVPLCSHEDLEPYIMRIADGDDSPLLTHQPITLLSLSSGTTNGRRKYVPFTSHSAKTTLQIFRLAAAYRSRVYPIREGGKILEFIYSSKKFETKGGLAAGTATTHYFDSEEFKIKQEQTKAFTCSPKSVVSSGDYKQSTYCHLILGLFCCDQVEFVTSTFAYSMVHAFSAFEETWEEICDDIEKGELSSKIDKPDMRKSVLEIISPNPCLAARVRRSCEELKGVDWFGLVPKLWPNVKYVYSIMTGSMEAYLKKLRHYSGGLPLVSADYGSTEGWIGVNVDPTAPPERATFAVVPTFSYFEFIPLYGKGEDNYGSATDDFVEGLPVPLSQVKLGQQYEIVLTTITGLYRYRLGDVVEVAGFFKRTPKLNFVCRRKLILTINIDKNTEKDLQLAVDKGCQALNRSRAELVDFTSHAETSDQVGHYVIYWEIKGEAGEEVLRECCTEMDSAFVDPGYIVSRRTNSIGALELRIVERGTFVKVLDYFIGNGVTMSQFKTPRCTNNQALLKILNECTVKRYYSTAYC